MSLLLGAFGAAIIIAFSTYFIAPKQKKIVTIHITKIIGHFVQNEVNKNVSKEVLEQEVKAYALNLEAKVKSLRKSPSSHCSAKRSEYRRHSRLYGSFIE